MLNDELYVGTTWGCVIIAEKATLRPITIFRPYEEDVRAIIPLSRCKVSGDKELCCPLLATIGRGYRSLLTRYTNVGVSTGSAIQSPVVSHTTMISNKQNMFVMLWRAENWGAS